MKVHESPFVGMGLEGMHGILGECAKPQVFLIKLYDSGDRTCSISKGPSCFGENLQGLFGKDRLVALSHTLSPLLNGLNLLCMCHCICYLAKS